MHPAYAGASGSLSAAKHAEGHVYVAGGSLYEPEVQTLAGEIAALPGVTQAAPLVEAQAMALGQGQISGVVVRGISEPDLRRTEIVSGNIVRGFP